MQTGYPSIRKLWSARASEKVSRELQDIFYDPQTSGGLLIAVPHESAGDLLKELKDRIPCAEQIGRVDTSEEYSVYLEKE